MSESKPAGTPDHAEIDPERLPDGWQYDGIVYTAGGCYTRTFSHPEREVRVTYDLGVGPVGAEYFDPRTADEACWGEFHGAIEFDHDELPELDPEDDDAAHLELCYAMMEQIEKRELRRGDAEQDRPDRPEPDEEHEGLAIHDHAPTLAWLTETAAGDGTVVCTRHDGDEYRTFRVTVEEVDTDG